MNEREKYSKKCISCNEIIRGQFVRALGGVYHINCFKCVDCGKICDKKFFQKAGINGPLCETDYFRRKGLICAKCGGAIRGPNIKALNKKYHLNHFTCAVCDILFKSNDSYYEHNGDIFCQTHYSEIFAKRCNGCHTSLLKQHKEADNDENIDPQESWHPECYNIYKSWNIRIELKNEISKESIKSKNYKDEIEKQKRVKEKINRIWSVLSEFEESSAECMADVISALNSARDSGCISLSSIEQAGKFVCCIDVLFSGIDEIEKKLEKFNDRIGLQHAKEPKQLTKKIISIFSFLVRKQYLTQKVISLVTSLAHTLRILIRYALLGAIKLENVHNDNTAIDSFLEKILTLKERQSELCNQLKNTNKRDIPSEYCPLCHRSVEEECIKLDDLCWHINCFHCQICKKSLYKTYDEEARMDLNNEKLYCERCSPQNTVTGFTHVTQLEQYTYLLNIALKELYVQNK